MRNSNIYKSDDTPKYTGEKSVYKKIILPNGDIKITDLIYYNEGKLLFKEGDLITNSSNPDSKGIKIRLRWRTYHRLGNSVKV